MFVHLVPTYRFRYQVPEMGKSGLFKSVSINFFIAAPFQKGKPRCRFRLVLKDMGCMLGEIFS
jgi:hypothetical protein